MKSNLNDTECEKCELANSKACDKCIEDNTFISISELREMLKKATQIEEFQKFVPRSWGDTRPDYEDVNFKHIDIESMDEQIKNLNK